MSSAPPASPPAGRSRFQLRDILALVVGYGMASLFIRALWPAGDPPPWLLAPALVLYAWLGLALSGPVVLVRRGPREPGPDADGQGADGPDADGPAARRPRDGSYTWAELAWISIGIYWIVMELVIIPTRLHGLTAADIALFGILPILACWMFRRFRSRASAPRPDPGWTHPAAVWLLLTWPIAWGCLIVIGRGLK